MYDRLPGLILGYHGCDRAVGEGVLSGKVDLMGSKNSYDWLGHGIYFWENNSVRAIEWARLLQHIPRGNRRKIRHPMAIGAVIDLGLCLNLLDAAFLAQLPLAYDELRDFHERSGQPFPENRPLAGSKDLLLRHLDCAVIETLHQLRNDGNKPSFDTAPGSSSKVSRFILERPFKNSITFRFVSATPIASRDTFGCAKICDRLLAAPAAPLQEPITRAQKNPLPSLRASVPFFRTSLLDLSPPGTTLPRMSAIAATRLGAGFENVAVDHLWRRVLASGRIVIGGGFVSLLLLTCLLYLPFTLNDSGSMYYNRQVEAMARHGPMWTSQSMLFGADELGNSIFSRCLLGGVISLMIGVAAATISVVLGVAVGLIAGYRGGWVDGLLMRIVDILYGLPYILLVILFKIALEQPLARVLHSPPAGNLVVLFLAIGLVSWLTMARVIRGQVLLLRSLPFVEAARAAGVTELRIFTRHLLPNLVGPITVYATLTVPQAILQESFLSFLGVGIQPPLPTWGSLASGGLMPALNPLHSLWWVLLFPCTLLALTLLSLNFLGDGLRDVFDPQRDAAKI